MAEAGRAVDRRTAVVFIAGGVTTLVALAGVAAFANAGTYVMQVYARGFFPLGAIGVGVVASSGYAAAAWFTGLRVTPRLLWSMVAALVVSYVIAQYIEYRFMVPGGAYGFLAWFDAVTCAMTFVADDGTRGSPFGGAAYFLRVVEVGAFAIGAWVLPAALRAKPYCERCRTYRRARKVATIAGGTDGDRGSEGYAAVCAAATAGDRGAFDRAIGEYGTSTGAAKKTPSWVAVSLVQCGRCGEGWISGTRFEDAPEGINRFAMPRRAICADAGHPLLAATSR